MKQSRPDQILTSTKTIFNRDLGEYRVKAYDQHGQCMSDCDYFTDDKQDAKDTASAMIDPTYVERMLANLAADTIEANKRIREPFGD